MWKALKLASGNLRIGNIEVPKYVNRLHQHDFVVELFQWVTGLSANSLLLVPEISIECVLIAIVQFLSSCLHVFNIKTKRIPISADHSTILHSVLLCSFANGTLGFCRSLRIPSILSFIQFLGRIQGP